LSVETVGQVAILRRRERLALDAAKPQDDRFLPVFAALADVGVTAVPVGYSDETAEQVRGQLRDYDGVLVWVDPIAAGQDRTVLDSVLRDVSADGVWVSAHPDVIREIGTKEVLYRTRHLGWGTDTYLYATFAGFAEEFPARLAAGRPRVLKQQRGNGGIGVWRVDLLGEAATDAIVRIQHAAPRDATTEDVSLRAFVDRCRPYFADGRTLVDQAFASRLPEGMIRAYLVQDRVVGFARQQPADSSAGVGVPPPDRVLGLPAAKTMFAPDAQQFEKLRTRLEHEWVPGLLDAVDVQHAELPLLWDADFLYGPPTESGDDTYILCEINASSVSPFPEQAPHALARAVHARLTT